MAREWRRWAELNWIWRSTWCSCIVGAALLAGCKKDATPLTAETSRYEVGEGSATFGASDATAPRPAAPASSGSAGSTDATAGSRPATTTPPSSAGSAAPGATAPAAGGSSPSSPPPAGQPPIQPPSRPREQLDGLDPPEGPPEAIWAFIESLDRRAPRGNTQQEMLQNVRDILGARHAAAQRLVNDKKADVELRRKGADVVLSTLQYLSDLGEQNVQRRVRDFCMSLRDDVDPDLALTGRMMVFSLDIADLVDGRSDQPSQLLESAMKILNEEKKTATVFEYLRTAALSMLEAGYKQEGRKLADALGQAFADNPDAENQRQIKLMFEEAQFLELEMNKKLLAFAQGQPDSLIPLVESTRQLLSHPDPGLGRLQQTAFIADAIERRAYLTEAGQIYDQIDVAFKDSKDEELPKLVRETVDYAKKRLGMVNQPLVLQGKLFDGSDFKQSDYSGKVVLITFWSAENVQYVQEELPQIKRLRDVYRDRGFDVVGVNVDSNRRLVEQFFGFQPMPWSTIMDGSDGMNKLVTQYGVRSIPFNILLDSKGVVVALHVNSQTLPAKLQELLPGGAGAPASPKPPAGSSGAAPLSKLGVTVASAALRGYHWLVEFVADLGRDETTHYVSLVDEPAADDNPYLAPQGLSRSELVDFLLKMLEKPQVIRARPGFDAALIEAADRVLAERKDDTQAIVAFEIKAAALHAQADQEAAGAQEALNAFVEQWQADERPRVAAEVRFLQLERRLLEVDMLPIEDVPPLLEQTKQFLQATKTRERHLRMASATVHAINRLDVEQREPYFQEFGRLFGASADKQLASYGRRVAALEPAPGQDLVGQPIELSGLTALGVELDWSAYRGKVVLIDFWATWCGPCRRETPLIKALREKYRERGLEVVGVNLDKDQQALAKYLDEQDLPWVNVIGEAAQATARRYDVKAIPLLLLVNQEGRAVAAAHKSSELTAKIEELLQ